MAALAGGETHGTGCTLALHHGGGAGPFGLESVDFGKPLLQEHRTSIGAHAALRKACDLMRERLGGGTALAVRHQPFAQADAMTLVRRHLAPGEDDVERAAAPADARQPHGAAVD